jgi:uncharacterized membrane protein YgcG
MNDTEWSEYRKTHPADEMVRMDALHKDSCTFCKVCKLCKKEWKNNVFRTEEQCKQLGHGARNVSSSSKRPRSGDGGRGGRGGGKKRRGG